ncbi:tyrosine-type recombinase/integrase [Candidatus Woesearchaeota archaeon]|nr:tyrosine-type recombinase/integrase [Candidatus Woesearchaeota archaeon]
MDHEIIKEILDITREEKMSRKAVYERLLARGSLKPGEEDLFNIIIDRALENELIPSNRIKIYKKARGKLPSVFTTEQMQFIFESCNRPKLAVVMWLGFFCGLRIREVCNLKITDVDLDRRKLSIKDSKNPLRGKQGYGKDRVVSIPQVAINPLKRWLDIIKGGEWFIPSMQDPNRPIRTKTIHEQFRFLLKKVGLSEKEYEKGFVQKNHGKNKPMVKSVYKYRFHTFRHTYATYLLEKGVPIENIQRSLGHKDLDTTLIYARISDKKTTEYVDDAFNRPLKLVNKESILNENKPVQQTNYNINNTANVLAVNNNTPISILQKRLAMGEIDLVTYEHLCKTLNGGNK